MKNKENILFLIMIAGHLLLCLCYFFIPGSPYSQNPVYTVICVLYTLFEIRMFWTDEKHFRFRIAALLIFSVCIVLLIINQTVPGFETPGWGYIVVLLSMPPLTAADSLKHFIPALAGLIIALAVTAVLAVRAIRGRTKSGS